MIKCLFVILPLFVCHVYSLVHTLTLWNRGIVSVYTVCPRKQEILPDHTSIQETSGRPDSIVTTPVFSGHVIRKKLQPYSIVH